ncbi:DUF6286 domain-containing protein [Actinokineospora bangkokensis]|uniref:DUF6286 domain-containing protein n=1 Tax=Actinokineospora bangkokensis TaxID=1193682 RepID=A0A1Q9LSJ2_9PSEU|nr:DUF6286 domain-containing protein [Actinokineospora bangkokensis]OLR94988.1 hypothetical protein BJP25_08450 [Actinokineospora bangkokensis]
MRVLVRILTCLLGLALAAAGGLLALEVGWTWARPTGGPLLVPWPAWRDRLAALTWQSTEVRVTAWVVAAAGLVLLLVALTARRRDIALLDPAPGTTVRTSPRSLARIIGLRVRAEDNVTGATVTATARVVRVRATSRLEAEEQLRPRLLAVVEDVLSDLPLARTPAISVVVDSPRDRS